MNSFEKELNYPAGCSIIYKVIRLKNGGRNMNQIDETEVKITESVDEAGEIAEESLPIKEKETETSLAADESKAEETAPKKRPLLQVPVLISLGLVILSLLAFFAYKIFWIAEPEGVTWVWSSETDNVKWYYEFEKDDVFKAYVGSFEITANYSKDKSDDAVSKLTISADVPYAQSLGCIFFGNEIDYKITGSRLAGSQEMTITYPDDPEGQEFVLTQTKERGEELELPEDFKEDEALTGEWINIYSTDDAKQTIVFNDDGSMSLSEAYRFSNGNFSEIRRNCTYTVSDNELNITWIAGETVVHHSDYVIKDGVLYMDGAAYYRADSEKATPDEAEE